MESTQKPGVVIYHEIEPAIDSMTNEQSGQLFKAIIKYSKYGEVPELNDPLVNMAWSLIRPNIDRDSKYYREKVLKNRKSGHTSAFKRNYAPKNGIDPEDEDALAAYIEERMSTDVGESQPTTITTPTTISTPTPTPTSDPITTPEGNTTPVPTAGANGKGVWGKTTPEQYFNQRRNSSIKALDNYVARM